MAGEVHKIVQEMADAAAPGKSRLPAAAKEELVRLTSELVDNDAAADQEYERYQGIAGRMLDATGLQDELRRAYRDRRILITGGTGCIGSVLVRQLLDYDPSDVFCIYHDSTDFEPVPGVVYVNVDIADEAELRDVVGRIGPDVIFHCAAQRSPMLAEREVARTIQSNVVGTRNVLLAARDVDAERVVHASTGKAMRYYTADVYAATKKIAEWLVADYAAEGRAAGLARFTHVVDNAVVLQKVDEALQEPDGVVRVHDPDIAFYAQSARESAQLLQIAGLAATDSARGVAIRSLGEPAQLLELVVGRMRSEPANGDTAIYLSGYDQGYERGNPPGLYDPENATERTPLINAIEASTAVPLPGAPNVDRFEVVLPPSEGIADKIVESLADACAHADALHARAELARAAKHIAEVMFQNCPEPLFERLHAMSSRADTQLPTSRNPRS